MTGKNIAASVRARLANHAAQAKRPYQEVLQYYAMERLLYRLSKSKHGQAFVLKGALMLRVWGAGATRPTKDVDLLGHTRNTLEHVSRVLSEVCTTDVEPDGMVYDPESVAASLITKDAEYQGVRVKLLGTLERARVVLQVDIGFGDLLVPEAETVEFPTILDFPAPRMKGYRRETVVAEKLHAMVFHGSLNTRMKDFYDIWLLASSFEFEGATVAQAIRATFAARGTDIEVAPIGLSDEFVDSARTRNNWAAFSRRLQLEGPSSDLNEIIRVQRRFLGPVLEACALGQAFDKHWRLAGTWT